MATLIGTIEADHVAVTVVERAEVVRVTQDSGDSIDIIILHGVAALDTLITKLQTARQMIAATHQIAV